jgi:hypothetical protein
MSAASVSPTPAMPDAVVEWFRPTDEEVAAVAAAPFRERFDGDHPVNGAGVLAAEAWIRRTCPAWCTIDHARDFGEATLSVVHWAHIGTVALEETDRRASVDVSVVADFSEGAAIAVGEPFVHLGFSVEEPQRPETMRAVAALLSQAVSVCEQIKAWTP